MSQVNADTLRHSGGTLGTDVRVKNTSVYESDGGTSVTQNLVQGLVKCWHRSGNDATVTDSLNVTSSTDNGTADYTYTFSNNFSNDDYGRAGQCVTDARRCQYSRSDDTSNFRVRHWHEDGGYADCENTTLIAGDLA